MSLSRRVALSVCALLLLLPRGLPAQKVAHPVVVVETNVGNITVELFPDQAPRTVENFLTYARSGFYRGTIFHRVIQDFMIQGGGFTPQMRQKATRPAIKNEATTLMKNERGTVAAARNGEVNGLTNSATRCSAA